MKLSSINLTCFFTGLLSLTLIVFSGCTPTRPQLPQAITTISLPSNVKGPTAIAANANTGYVYIMGDYPNVAVFQEDMFVTTLPVGDQDIRRLAVDSAHDRVYILNQDDHTVTVIKGVEVITTLPLAGREPTGIAINPNTGWVYVVTNQSSGDGFYTQDTIEGNLTVIAQDKVKEHIHLGDTFAVFVEVDPIYEYIYVGAAGGDVVVLKDHQEVARYPGEYTVRDMDVDLRTGDVYALTPTASGLNFSRFRQGQLIERIGVSKKNSVIEKLQVHPNTGDIYIFDTGRKEVIVVRPTEDADQGLRIIGRVLVGNLPSKMAIDTKTGNVYVTNLFDNTVTAIQGTEVLTTYQVGWYPYGIGVNPANGWVYVANTNADSITILGFE